MNTNTGAVYRDEADIAAAKERGEPVVEISAQAADVVEAGLRVTRKCCPEHAFAVNRQQRRRADRTCPHMKRRR